METIYILAVISKGNEYRIRDRTLTTRVNPHPKILSEQIADFTRQVANEAREKLQAENEIMGKLPDSISIGLTCDFCPCDVSEKLIAEPTEPPEKVIERAVNNIRVAMRKELSNAIFDNPTFTNQPMNLVHGWEMLLQ